MNAKMNWMLALPLLCSMTAISQTVNGRVTDSTGAIVQKAQVTARNTKTGVDSKTVTTSAGDYSIPYLTPASVVTLKPAT